MTNIHQNLGPFDTAGIPTTVVLNGLSQTLKDVNQRIDAIQETVLQLVQEAKTHNATQLQQLQHLDFASQAITDIVSAMKYLKENTPQELLLNRRQLSDILILEKLRTDLKLSEDTKNTTLKFGDLNLF